MKRIIRKRLLTKKEADRDDKIRRQVAAELPELIARHHGKFCCPTAGKSSKTRSRSTTAW